MTRSSTEVSLGELVRLAFPAGTPLPPAPYRDRPVKWVVMSGAGVMPGAGDLVLCGQVPDQAELEAWAAGGIVGVVLFLKTPAAQAARLPIISLAAGASLRDIQQSA